MSKGGMKMNWDAISSVGTIGMLVFFIAVSIIQNFQTREALQYTRESMDRSDRVNKLDMRAYIAVTEISFHQFEIGKQIAMDVRIMNTGKTPAHHISWCGMMGFGGLGMEENKIDEAIINHPHEENFVLGGFVPFVQKHVLSKNITNGEYAKIMDGSLALFIYGEFVYVDVFGEKHFTHYCMLYDAILRSFYMYGHYNDAE